MSEQSRLRRYKTYCVHARGKRVVGSRLVFGCDEDATSLRGTKVDHLCLRLIRVDPINLNNGHVVTLEPDILTRKRAYVDDLEEIGLPRLNRHRQVLGIVEEDSLRNGLRTGWVGLVDELWDQDLHLLVIPVRDREREPLVILVREIWITDDQRSPEAVRVLSFVVRVIPVSAWLIDLVHQLVLSARLVKLSHGEIIGKLGSRRNSTLRHLSWAIHLSGAVHEQAMEVEGCGLIAQLIVDIDNDSIANRRRHYW